MPKTKDAFAFRDFDKDRILTRECFLLKEIVDDETDETIIVAVISYVQKAFMDNDYFKVQYFLYGLEFDRDILHDEFKNQLDRHLRRLARYSSTMNQKFTEAEDIPLEPIYRKIQRAKRLTNAYQNIYLAMLNLAKKLKAAIAEIRYELTGRYKQTFSQRLKEARLAAGLNQNQLAEMLGMTQGGYGQYETGTREPSLATFAKIAKILNCSADWLLGIDEPKIFIKVPESYNEPVRDDDLPF